MKLKNVFIGMVAGALLSIALRYAGVGTPPTPLTLIVTVIVIALAMLLIWAIRGLARLAANAGRTCDLCGKPRDPKSKAPGAWEYGIRACDGCAAMLHERHKDDPPISRYQPPT